MIDSLTVVVKTVILAEFQSMLINTFCIIGKNIDTFLSLQKKTVATSNCSSNLGTRFTTCASWCIRSSIQELEICYG